MRTSHNFAKAGGMKRFLCMFLVFLMMVAVAGCITSDDDEKKTDDTANGDDGGGGNGSGSGALVAADYVPLVTGAEWQSRSEDGGFTYTTDSSITGTKDFDGKTYHVMVEDGSEESYLRIANNVVYMYADAQFFAKPAAGAQPSVGRRALRSQFRTGIEIPFFDFSRAEGQTWKAYSDEVTELGSTVSISLTGKYRGVQNVTVPAGTFAECPVFEMVIQSSYTSSYQGQTFSGTYSETLVTWLGKGAGPVKSTSSYRDDSGGEVYESSDTTELTWYTIPGGASGGTKVDDSGGNGGGGGDDNGGGTDGTGIGTGQYSVTGRVVDQSGAGIAGITVTIFDEYKEEKVTTNAQGYYTFTNIASGSYGLYCDETDAYGFSPWIGHVDVEGKDAAPLEEFVGSPPDDE